ncbi:MAG: MBL fold metallo-hydrolase [Thermodesulfobacteriota bacterium]|nr:MBL fold metallo-hydrolase [Thermodesulfobacteriota bacterium]
MKVMPQSVTQRIVTRKGTRIEIIDAGGFLLDGGSMFGRIPRVMWEKWFPADDKNRILMATNTLRVETDAETYLVDCGMGTAYDEKTRRILGIENQGPYVIKGGIDHLICTHLHFDHIGGVHNLDIQGDIIVSQKEWTDAWIKDPLTQGSYRGKDLEIIKKKVSLVDGQTDLTPAIRLIPTPGHTRGHMGVLIDDEVFFAGDLVPTSSHVHLPCIMAYDLFPVEVMRTKEDILGQAAENNWLIVFEHDPYRATGRVQREGDSFVLSEI